MLLHLKLTSTNKADSAVLKEKNIAASVENELTDAAPNGQSSDSHCTWSSN